MSETDIGTNVVPWKPEAWAERLCAEQPMTLTPMVPEGLPDLQAFMAGLVEGVVRTNLRLTQEMFLVDSPRAFIELQQRFLREYFSAFEEGAAALVRYGCHAQAGPPLRP